MRTALLLAYHYPPLGGVAVMRVLRFSKYLEEFGYRPIVVCVEGGPKHEPRDPALLQEIPAHAIIERVRCWEPDNFSDSWDIPHEKVVRNLFKLFAKALFPDDRAFWVAPVVRRIKQLVKEHQPSVIWATAQPWSTLVAGMKAKDATGIPLVLDFRDDWTTSNADFRKTKRIGKERALEQRVLASADAVISVTPQIVAALQERRPANLRADQFHLIPNGFDPAHFPTEIPKPSSPSSQTPFTILHAGGLYDKRPVTPLLEALDAWFASHPERKNSVKIILAGRSSPQVIAEIAASSLRENIEQPGFLSHTKIRELMVESHLNLLMIEQVKSAAWLFTGKAFEYLGARRPILMMGPDPSPLATIVVESGLGRVSSHDQPARTAAILEEIFLAADKGLDLTGNAKVEAYNARKQCAELAEIFGRVQKS